MKWLQQLTEAKYWTDSVQKKYKIKTNMVSEAEMQSVFLDQWNKWLTTAVHMQQRRLEC